MLRETMRRHQNKLTLADDSRGGLKSAQTRREIRDARKQELLRGLDRVIERYPDIKEATIARRKLVYGINSDAGQDRGNPVARSRARYGVNFPLLRDPSDPLFKHPPKGEPPDDLLSETYVERLTVGWRPNPKGKST